MKIRIYTIFISSLFLLLQTGCSTTGSSYDQRSEPRRIISILPKSINNFIAGETTVYEDPSSGVSIGYNAYEDTPDEIVVTVYIYDSGYKSIEDGIDSRAIVCTKEVFIELLMNDIDWKRSHRNVRDLQDKTIELDIGEVKPLKMLNIFFVFDRIYDDNENESVTFLSDLLLVGLKGYICKIRVSICDCPNKRIENEIKEQEVREFLRVLLTKINSYQTGEFLNRKSPTT